MRTYVISNLNEDASPDAITVPGEDVDPAAIVLADRRENMINYKAARDRGIERFLEIHREAGGEQMDFSDEKAPAPSPLDNILVVTTWISARFARWWIWNISYPVKMWVHFRFYREKTLPDGERAIRALLRDAFATAGIKDSDFPYAVQGLPAPEPAKRGFCRLFSRTG